MAMYNLVQPTLTDGQRTDFQVDANGNLRIVASAQVYQTGRVALVAGSGNVANAVAAATLTPAATVTAFLSGFEITGSGATAGLPVTVTVAGLLGGTRHYTYVFAVGALVANTPLLVEFNPPLPASAINTAIVVSCPAGGAGNTNNTVVAHGYSA